MTLHIDNEMNVRVDKSGTEPLVFTPDVETCDTEAPSVIDDL